MTIKALYPNVRPTLNLDFAKTKALDPRVTFTRASTATFVGSNGLIQTAASGAARFDHNPATGESLGLLVEEARTNEMSQSIIRPDDAGIYSRWTGFDGASIIPDAELAPDGTLTAALITFPQSVNVPSVRRQTTIASGARTISVWLKAKSGKLWAMVDLGAGQTVGTQWTRVTYTVAGGSSNFAGIYCPTSLVFTEFYAWGFQQEPGSFPTSYIPTSGSTVTRAADVATLANTGSSIFPTSAFTTVNSPFGTAGGGTTVKLVGPTVKRTAVYNGDLTQAQINALAGVNDDFWRWRVLGSSFALPNFTTNGSVTVDWGDGVVETLTTAVHTFTNGGGYHDIGFRLNSGTFFKPYINNNATYKDRVIAVGPAPASMKVDANSAFRSCQSLKAFDATVDATGGTNFSFAFYQCSSLTSLPLINTAAVTNLTYAWEGCSSLASFALLNTAAVTNLTNTWYNCSALTSFPLINTAAVTSFYQAWRGCSSLTSFPLINTAAGTNFQSTWQGLSLLTSFPLVDTSAGTNFRQAWYGCSGLTSFPLINTAAGTNFLSAWTGCSSLTSFPLIDTGAGTIFLQAWESCTNLTSFPLINTGAGTDFSRAWISCTNLSSFPANMFNTTGTLVATAFTSAFQNCALTATSIENILTSLVTNGQSNITLTLSGGTNAGASTWTANAVTAYNTLISRGWTITRNA
jgi:hypothetical protein